jgi:hypothetical protein
MVMTVLIILVVVNINATRKLEKHNGDKRPGNNPIKSKIPVAIKKVHTTYQQLPQLMSRVDFGWLLEAMHAKEMIQIGVKKGDFAQSVLTKWRSARAYYGVEPLAYDKSLQLNDNIQNKAFVQAETLLKKFGSKVILIREYLNIVHRNFKNSTVDFVYIDGLRHDYCAVMNDLNVYYPKLKCGTSWGLFT